jgi:hypothetical protein
VVRVRVTSPVMAQQHNIKGVNLRVGPFAREGFITSLCEGEMVDDSGMRCGIITDMGIADSYKDSRGNLPDSRYKH